ncbi:phage major capsid protein [Staphylococcus epidermidis]|nr:phage major capsid protein [Staphylococcus epidermidis]
MASRQTGDIRGAMSTTVGTEGGYTVATEFSRSLLEAMKQMGGVRSVASAIQTGTGAQMLFPTANSTQEEGEIVGQNVQVGKQDTTFGQASIDVYKYSSEHRRAIRAAAGLVHRHRGYIKNLLRLRGSHQNRHQTVGTGTGQPMGW